MNRLALNPVPRPGDPRLALLNVPAPWCAPRAIRLQSMLLPGCSCIEAEVRQDVFHMRETFVAGVVSEDRR